MEFEELCEEIANGLNKRDHSIFILTSNYGLFREEKSEEKVFRQLNLEMDIRPIWSSIKFFVGRKNRLQKDIQTLENTVRRVEPDLFVVWGAWNISNLFLSHAEQIMPNRVVYYFADYWPTLPDANTQHWLEQLHKRSTIHPITLLARLALRSLQRENSFPPLKFEKTICVSKSVREILYEHGVPVEHASIIYNGIRCEDFLQPTGKRRLRKPHQPLSLLYAGRIAPEKGIHLAIEALAALLRKGYLIQLEIIGQRHSEYSQSLENQINNLKLNQNVKLTDRVPREKMPQVLARHDILLVPSIWSEPLPRILQEGMAAGLVVIAANIGGIVEAIDDGVDGIFFSHNDVEDLKNKIELLYKSPDLLDRISKAGVRKAFTKFDIQRTVEQIEAFLNNVAS